MRCMNCTTASTTMVMKTLIVILFFIQATRGQDEEHLWCYECGTGVPGEPDCMVFYLASSWRGFRRKCPGDSVCVKTMPGLEISNELNAVRGCTPKVSLSRTTHQNGCWSHPSTSTVTCYCSHNLCNGAQTHCITMQSSIMILCSLLLFALNRKS